MVNIPNWLPDCGSHSDALLDFFLSSDASICSTIHCLPTKIKMGRPISSHSLWLFRAGLDGLFDHLGDVPWEDIFKLSSSAAAKEFCELV